MPKRVVSLGEAMVRYSTKGHTPLEEATELEMRVAGAESNVAVVCARLGLRATWISKLTNNPLGRFIAAEIRKHGVTTDIVWTDDFRVGTYYIEFGAPPRAIQVHYDRKGSAMSHLTPKEVPWGAVQQADLFHITGITPALSDFCRQTTQRALEEARKAGISISFDVNYRSKLWEPQHAQVALEELLPMADIVFVSVDDAKVVFGLQGEDEEIATWFAQEFSPEVAVITLGDRGALAYQDGKIRRVDAYPTETVDPIGTGDAFAAGFIFGYLTGDLKKALEWAAAAAALKRTMPGDIAVVTPKQVQELIQRSEVGEIQR